jgi:hypothetical protein
MGCAYYFIGRQIDERGDSSWLSIQDMSNLNRSFTSDAEAAEFEMSQYVTSFYWALYTISTTGYGNVKPSQNSEMIFCMICMVVGAIVCDAGITAVLTSLIENRDHQAGTNSRRLECCKRYMTHALAGDTRVQGQVLDFFNYEDTELHNIDSETVLQQIGAGLRLAKVSIDCEKVLLKSEVVGKYEHGVVCTLMRSLEAHLIIPSQTIVSADVDESHYVVLKSGRAKGTDDAGGRHIFQSGSVVSNLEETARRAKNGPVTHGLRIVVHKAWNLPKTDLFGACDPYVEITYGSHGKLRTTVKKVTRSPVWREIFYVKMTADITDVHFKLFDWNRVEDDEIVGSFSVPTTEMSTDDEVTYDLKDEVGGGNCGTLSLSLHHGRLQDNQLMKSAALTVVAETYCQVYKLDVKALKKVDEYLLKLGEPEVGDRLPYYDDSETAVEKFKRETMAKDKLTSLAADSMKEILCDDSFAESGTNTSRTMSRADSGAYDVSGPEMGSAGALMKKEGAQDSMFKPRKSSMMGSLPPANGRRFTGKNSNFNTGLGEAPPAEDSSRRGSFKFGFSRAPSERSGKGSFRGK